MQLSTAFRGSMYGLACLASLMLAMAEGSPWPALTIPLAVAALIFSEHYKVFQLSVFWANALGLGAVYLAGTEFFGENIEGRLLSGAHLLVYLSWIVLFQEKNERQYWSMCALGVLQVAVASVLTNEGWFGVMLVGYLFFALWTLSVFSLYRAQQQFDNAEQQAVATHGDQPAPSIASPAAPRRPEVAALSRQTAVGQPPARTSMTRGSVHHDPREQWINARFVLVTFGTACSALVIGAAFFLFVPRIWIGKATAFGDEALPGRPALTGFSGEVQLGDIGQILESTERVLQIRVFNNSNDQELSVAEYADRLGYEEPTFRGTVLRSYRKGRWYAESPSRRSRSHYDSMRATMRPGMAGAARQEIRLQPIGTDVLFALHPVRDCVIEDGRASVRKHIETSVLRLSQGGGNKESTEYIVFSSMPIRSARAGARARLPVPRDLALEYRNNRDSLSGYLHLPEGLDRLQQAAHDIVAPQPGGTALPPLEKAERLEHYLHSTGGFTYTLNMSIRDPSIDPVEDFLFNRKSGHCEYFASALTLMLRAVDIPSRLVSGFKGGDKSGRYFEVQQRHAHAWVEAYIDDAWVVFDPTPAARSASVDSLAPSLRSWTDLRRRLSMIWSQDIVQMSLTRQRRAIYNPLKEWWAGSGDTREKVAGIAGGIKDLLLSPGRWFSWQGGLLAFALLTTMTAVVYGMRQLVALLKKLRLRLTVDRSRQQVRVDFYERFQRLLADRGLTREAAQTQREFGAHVRKHLGAVLSTSQLSTFPDDLISMFYRVRFGAEHLEAADLQSIDRQLALLESCLAAPKTNGSAATSSHSPNQS